MSRTPASNRSDNTEPRASAEGSARKRFVLMAALELWESPSVPYLPGMCVGAEELRRFFRRDRYMGVHRDPMLQNQDATKKAILDAIARIGAKASVTDQFIFYFGGHGLRWRQPGGNWQYYLVPYDGDPADPIGSCLSMAELGEALQSLHAEQTVLILDCCHAGGVFWGWTPAFLKEVIEGWRNPYIMAAAGPHGPAYVHSDAGSLFAQALIDTLRDPGRGSRWDGPVSAQLAYAQTSVSVRSAMMDAGLPISPTASSGHGEDIFLFQAGETPVNPYKGLHSFAVEDVKHFHGRQEETDDLENRVIENAFFLLTGESGCGKSSLLHAGVAARFLAKPDWIVASVRLGDEDPLVTITKVVKKVLTEAGKDGQDTDISEAWFRKLTQNPSLVVPPGHRLLLIIDQFEQFFVQSASDNRQAVLEWLDGIAIKGLGWPVHVVIGLRLDFYPDFARRVEFPQSRQHIVRAIAKTTLAEVITGPLFAVGGSVERGLIDAVKHDLHNTPGELALLQHALFRLWEASHRGHLTLAAYRQIGGIGGALESHATSAYEGLGTESRQTMARRILLALIHFGDGGRHARLSVSRDTLLNHFKVTRKEEAEAVLEYLLNARLLTTRKDDPDTPKIEIAHEILLERWQTLRGWMDANAPFLRWQQRFQHFSQEWRRDHEPGRRRSPFSQPVQGSLLDESEGWLRRQPEDVPEEWKRLIVESRRNRKRRRFSTASAMIILALLSIAGLYQWYRIQTDSYQIDQVLAESGTLPDSVFTEENWIEWIQARMVFEKSWKGRLDIPEKLRESRPLLLAEVARALTKVGHTEVAKSLALEARLAIPGDAHNALAVRAGLATSGVFHALGMNTESDNLIADAQRSLPLVEDPTEHDRAVAALATEELRQSRIGLSAALAQIDKIQDPDTRHDSQMAAAVEWAILGHFNEAAVFVEELGDPLSVIQYLSDLATKMPIPENGARMLDKAVEKLKAQAKAMGDPNYAAQVAYISFATQAELGASRADATVPEEIQLPLYRALASVSLAHALLRQSSGRHSRVILDDGLEEASRITDLTNQSRALAEIAKGFAQLGEYRRARQLAEKCQSKDRLEVFSAILREYSAKRADP